MHHIEKFKKLQDTETTDSFITVQIRTNSSDMLQKQPDRDNFFYYEYVVILWRNARNFLDLIF